MLHPARWEKIVLVARILRRRVSSMDDQFILFYSIDDILYLYNFDRALSTNLFHLVSEIEIKLKSYLVEIVYELSHNPFSYLVKHN